MTPIELPGHTLRKASARRPVEAMAYRRGFELGQLYAANGWVYQTLYVRIYRQ